ncbi:MAG: response regulator [bacterium]|nr:response regulator [bacterium]
MPRILVVDDDPQVRSLLGKILEREDYDVTTAADGQEAVTAYQSEPFDLVITDLVMPEKEGIETFNELRSFDPEVKVVAISGGGRIGAQDYLSWARACGVAHTFAKPIDREELLAVVRELVGSAVT